MNTRLTAGGTNHSSQIYFYSCKQEPFSFHRQPRSDESHGFISAISQSFSKKETVWRNQREAVRIHSFCFIFTVGGPHVRSMARTLCGAGTRCFCFIFTAGRHHFRSMTVTRSEQSSFVLVSGACWLTVVVW